jgi:nucleotide-binding universal stress UspA family protein
MTDVVVPDAVDAVVIPLDGSEFSLVALPVGLELANALHAAVHVVSAVGTEDEVTAREAYLDSLGLGPAVTRMVVVDLDPAGMIHESIKRLGRAVACVATHGRGRTAALVGSVATDVVARGHDPLVVVGPFVEAAPRGKGLVASVDDTPAAGSLVQVASGWARLLGQPLVIVTVAEPVPEPVRPPARRVFGPDGDVDAYLDSLAAPLREGGIDVDTAPVYDPIGPGEGVHAYLESHPAALVAVNSRAREGVARLVFGSTAASIIYHSTAPVLVVPRQLPAAGPEADSS